jgi:apolipoprotein N-acyltransferase
MLLRILRNNRGQNAPGSAASFANSQSRTLFLIALSGILLSLSFSTFKLSFLAWIGFIPFFFAIKDMSAKQVFLFSCICGFLFFVLSMSWLFYVTSAGWILLSLYQGLYFGVFGLIFYVFSQTKNRKPLLASRPAQTINYLILPSAWCLLEYIRANLFGGIGWNLLAYSQYEYLPIIQIADITGAYGISFLIILVNVSLFEIISILQDRRRVGLIFRFISVSCIVAIVLIYGQRQINQYRALKDRADKTSMSLLQGNIAQMQKWDNRYRQHILAEYKKLTLQAAKQDPDIIIWPETSIPGYLNKDPDLMHYMEDLSRSSGIPILVGAPMSDIAENHRDLEYNSAVLYSAEGDIIERYDKLQLVMFGEFIPFERYLPGLRGFFPITGRFVPGDEYVIFKLENRHHDEQSRFGVLVCFEDVFPGLVRDFVVRGVDFMVNITNDAWFGKTAAAYQHAANSVFRAVENRRPFARSANTGLSCFIDRTGRIEKKVDVSGETLFVRGHITESVNISRDYSLTFYTKHGDIFILFCLLILCCFMMSSQNDNVT